jgi:hypothetical protein
MVLSRPQADFLVAVRNVQAGYEPVEQLPVCTQLGKQRVALSWPVEPSTVRLSSVLRAFSSRFTSSAVPHAWRSVSNSVGVST